MGSFFNCRCERTQPQQAQYSEFGREASLRTGPLWGLRQQSGRIIREQDRQWHSWGEGQGPSSDLVRWWILLLLFWYSTNRTSWCLPNCHPPLREISLVIYILLHPLSWPSICQLRRSPLECLSHPAFPSTCCPSTLVPSFGDDREGCGGWHIVLSSQDTSCRGHDVPRRFLLVAVGLP